MASTPGGAISFAVLRLVPSLRHTHPIPAQGRQGAAFRDRGFAFETFRGGERRNSKPSGRGSEKSPLSASLSFLVRILLLVRLRCVRLSGQLLLGRGTQKHRIGR